MTTLAAPVQHVPPVPFLDLQAQFRTIEREIRTALDEVLASSSYILGPAVTDFERRFAEVCGVSHCVALNSGTSALHVAMLCLGIGPGDEVIVPSMTFVATVWPVSYLGAKPVFVDVDPQRYTLDPARLEAAITPRTRAIVPVHLYGQCADMDPILQIAQRHGIAVIEDAAQAHGASYRGRPAGSMSAIACFSFYPGKNLGAYGEGGAIVTDRQDLADRARMLRDHGQKQRYVHEIVGYNYRMDGLQGAVLGVKLRHLEEWTAGRNRVAARYHEWLAGSGVIRPAPCPDGRHAYHLYVIRHPRRDALRARLQKAGIQTGLHYPIPVHLQEPYRPLGYREGSLPVSEEIARTCLSLPMYPELSEEQVRRVVEAIRRESPED